MDKYTQEYLKAIKEAKTDEDIVKLLTKIYEDGFADGFDAS